jgi:hypothetical protein
VGDQDEAHGGDLTLRCWLKGRVSYVLAVNCTSRRRFLALIGERASAEQLAATLPAEQLVTASAGHGAKGRRLYDWTRSSCARLPQSTWPDGRSLTATPTVVVAAEP